MLLTLVLGVNLRWLCSNLTLFLWIVILFKILCGSLISWIFNRFPVPVQYIWENSLEHNINCLMYFSLLCRYAVTRAFCIAFVMTFFSIFDVPVFWPILLFYFCTLTFVTMKRQIQHMIKYKYVPFSFGKQASISIYHFLLPQKSILPILFLYKLC